jgi:hypothetical protein
MARLCFGTFAQVLRLCRLEGVIDREIVGIMTRTADPTCQYIHHNNASAVSRLLSCTGNLSNGNISDSGSATVKKPGESISNVITASQRANRDDVVKKFRENVVPLLDEDKKELLVLALLDIIENDSVLDDDKKLSFEKYIGQTKNALLSQGDFALDEFLSGIFLYTVAAGVKNTVGKETVKGLTLQYIGELKNTREIKVVDTTYKEVGIESDDTPTDLELDVSSDSIVVIDSFINEDFEEYLSNVSIRYSKIKTLLYDKTPKEFYSFYVCNDLKNDGVIINNLIAEKLFSIPRFSIVTGIGGLGKSMMMRHLLLDAVINFDRLKLLPILVPLKDYGESELDVFEYVFLTAQQFDENLTREKYAAILKNGSGLILLDGLDEVRTAVFSRFAQEVERFTNAYPQNYYVISSRPSSKLVALNKFNELELQPFDKSQALKMIDNFQFSLGELRIKESFRSRLDSELWWSHQDFAENPLLLTIMLMTYEEYAEIPSKIHKFYNMAFETLAKKHDDTKLLDREFKSGLSKDKIAHYFAKICFLSYKDEKVEFTESEFSSYFERCFRNSSQETTALDFLHDLSANLCMLLKEGEKYHFVHRSFQEYFCALNFKAGFERVSTDRKRTMSSGLLSFFDGPRDTCSEKVLEMLYDMIPEKVEEYIIIPKLEQILGNDSMDDNIGYWNIIERAFGNLKCWYEYHENIEYDEEENVEVDESYYDFALGVDGHIDSTVLRFVLFNLLRLFENQDLDDTYYDNEEIMEKVPLIVDEIKNVIMEETDSCTITYDTASNYVAVQYSAFAELIKRNWMGKYNYYEKYGEHVFWLSLEVIRKDIEKYSALKSVIENKDFSLWKVCLALQDYLRILKTRQEKIDEEWAEDFI